MWIWKREGETEEEARERTETGLRRFAIGAAGVASLLALGTIGYCALREHRLNSMLRNAISRVDEMTEVRVSEGIVNRGITEAVNRETSKAAQRAVQAVSDNMSRQVEKRVTEAFKANYGALQETIAAQVAKEAAKINKDDLMDSVIELAKDKVAEQFDEKLDDILAGYNKSLDNVGKIYQSIADSMSKKDGGKGIKLELA